MMGVLALSAPALAGPQFGDAGGVGSSTSTYSGTEPTGGTYSINGLTGVGSFSGLTLPSQTAGKVFASPSGSAGAPSFRALTSLDIPPLNQNTTGTAANVTGTVAIANGGTGATTALGITTALQYQQSGSGSVSRSLTSRLQERKSLADFGCDLTGATDTSTCVNTALVSFGTGGGRLAVTGKVLLSSPINVPIGVTIEGDCVMPGSPGTNLSSPYGTYTCGVLMLSGANTTINMGAGTGLQSVIVYRAGMAFPSADSTAFTGTAVTAAGDDVSINHVLVMGFTRGFYSTGFARQRIEYFYGDNNTGIEIANCLDIAYISHSHMWPFATIATNGAYTGLIRTGAAYYFHDIVDWGKITDSFSYGYNRGIRLLNVSSATVNGGGSDNVWQAGTGPLFTGSIGLSIENSGDTRVIGYQAAAQQTAGIYINSPGLNTTIQSYAVWGTSTHGVLIDAGNATIGGSLFGSLNSVVNGVTINNGSSRVAIAGNVFGTISGSPVNTPVTNNTIFIGQNDYQTITGNNADGHMVATTLASTGTMTVPMVGEVFNITGTTTVSVLGGGWQGRRVTLIFGSPLTMTSSAGSYNAVHLSGGTNWTVSGGSALTLVHSGSQWYEVGRSQ